ncbi:MAG: sulfide:quinone oxidoreductase, partial [Solirubrobacteraceae bacterium]|nr:sulfide:quinone oxidoreductase [Solirubrobacteraceae bacterium]
MAAAPLPAHKDRPPNVVIAGGGIAALELLLALRAIAGPLVDITLLTEGAELTPPPMTIAEPFERGGAYTYSWSQIAADQHARLVLDALVAVDTGAQVVFTRGGLRLDYDVLAVATGARRVAPFAGALTVGTPDDASAPLRALIADVRTRAGSSLAFALPSPSIWPLPLYELAVLSAHELREHGCAATVRIVTPEQHALGLFGPAARAAIALQLGVLRIEMITDAQPREVVAGGLRLDDGSVVGADHVVTLAEIVARPIPGLPSDRGGFVPVDGSGR